MTGMALIEEITYESVLKDMLAAYEAEAGFVPDEASDISIRLRVLASQIHSAAETGKWLLRQMGAEDTLAFEDAAFASFNKRVAEFKEPGRGFQYS